MGYGRRRCEIRSDESRGLAGFTGRTPAHKFQRGPRFIDGCDFDIDEADRQHVRADAVFGKVDVARRALFRPRDPQRSAVTNRRDRRSDALGKRPGALGKKVHDVERGASARRANVSRDLSAIDCVTQECFVIVRGSDRGDSCCGRNASFCASDFPEYPNCGVLMMSGAPSRVVPVCGPAQREPAALRLSGELREEAFDRVGCVSGGLFGRYCGLSGRLLRRGGCLRGFIADRS